MAVRKKTIRRKPVPANDDGHAVPLARRPAWQGHLRLSLVSCPVALFSAVYRGADISFHLLNPRTGNRIRMVPTDPDTGPLERAELVKGYEISPDRYVVLTPDDFDAVKLETTHTLDIERFVDAASIDRLYWNEPYFLLPTGKESSEAYGVIRAAMAEARRIALGRVVMHTRERLMAIEPRGKGLVCWSLRTAGEVIPADTVFHDIRADRPDRQMVEIASRIIAQKEGAFEPSKFEDRYEQALRDLIRRKSRGEKLVRAAPPEDTNVVDLMDALKKSLRGRNAAARVAVTPPARGRARAHDLPARRRR